MKTFLLFFIFYIINLYPQISPGDLTNAHANLEGLSNCTKCHVLGEQVYNSKCLDCHTEIKELMNKRRGYHSSDEVQEKNCWDCHSEHHGRNFRIINLNTENFNHSKTRFQLTGSHLEIKCTDCHNAKFISDSNIRKRRNTYLGLNQECISCHQDIHQSTLGENCSGCHSTEKFKPAEKFNHINTKFILTGAHLQTDCIECHPVEKRNGKDYQKFSGISFANCSSCHRDVHKGNFGNDCKSCHNTNSFHQINRSAFDHNKTDFPLTGKHISVNCNDCHKVNLAAKLKYQNCKECHEDYHKKEFVVNGEIRDCRSCHSETGFTPSLFSVDDHNKSEFKLTGAHLAVSCNNCHYKEERWQFKNIGLKCIDCHENIHGNEISVKFIPENNCSFCHSANRWSETSFDHNKTEFVLMGRHKEVNCRSCHYKTRGTKSIYQFASLEKDCENCHEDIHFNQFRIGKNSDCQRCHSFNNWKPENFDHNKTKFPLSGAHEKLKCSQCHKTVTKNGNSFIQFKLENFQCAYCHS